MENSKTLEKSFFLTYDTEGNLSHRGWYIEPVDPGWHLVQYCEWIMGGPSNMQIVSIGEMATWEWWWNQEDWDNACKVAMRHAERKDKADAD